MNRIIAVVRGPSRDSSVNALFQLVRPHCEASGQWILTGAVRSNNFGREVERVEFVCPHCLRPNADAIEQLNRIQGDWTWKNGSQKWYALDYDHGSRRMWAMPEGYGIYLTMEAYG